MMRSWGFKALNDGNLVVKLVWSEENGPNSVDLGKIYCSLPRFLFEKLEEGKV